MKTLIETDRLILREITLNDTPEMFELYSDPEILRYTGETVTETIEEMEKAIKIRIKNYKKYGYGRWATILKSENKFIGWAGLAYLPEFDKIDIGYRFLQEYWGMGFATEASHAILAHAFEKLNLKEIIAIAMKGNKGSIKVMEKIGMKFDKYAPYEPDGEDVVWYWCDKKLIAKNKQS